MSEHITALNLVLNEVQPKFSSLLRRVSKVLKFAKSFIEFVNFFLFKKGDNGTRALLRELATAGQTRSPSPYPPF